MSAGTRPRGRAADGRWCVADPAHRGKYLSVFWSGSSLQQAIGPALVTGLLAVSPFALWPVFGALLGVGCLASAWIVPADPSA